MPTPSKLTVDFSNVGERREGGRAFHGPEGDYLLKIADLSVNENKDKDGSHLLWKFGIEAPASQKGKGLVYHRTSLKPENLWSLRNVLEDLGIPVPQKAVALPIAAIAKSGRIMGATLVDGEPYNNKVKSEIAATFSKDKYTASAETADSDDDTSDDEIDTEEEEETTDELDIEDI